MARLRAIMERHVERDTVGGIAWLLARDDDVQVGVAGSLTRGEPETVQRDTVFRLSSMTKPIVAVAALLLVEDCTIRLDDPVDALLPELADRRVLVDGRGPLDGETVPAERSITLYDLLTFRLGLGMDFAAPWPQPLIVAMEELELGGGPPQPQGPPDADEWMRRLSTLPLLHQPGERWLYNTGAEVLGVLISRASGQPLEQFLRERVFEPLGMVDTGFWTEQTKRLTSAYATNPETGERFLFDPPDGQWAAAPAFPSGAAGLVSTVDDVHAFGRMLLSGGELPDRTRLLARTTVEAMTTDHLGVDRGASGPGADATGGWGLGVGVQVRRSGIAHPPESYGWAGGLGSAWANDPHEHLVAVVLTTDAFASAFPLPAVIQDFLTGAYVALG